MRRTALVLALSLVAACSSPVSSDGGGGHNCTLIGCLNGVSMSLSVDAKPEWMQGATFEVCRGSLCGRATIAGNVSAGTGASLTGGLSGLVVVTPLTTGSYRVELEQVGGAEPASDFANGDHWRITVTGADGTVAATFDRVATYVDSWPNGKDCDPSPCRQATLESGSIYVP